jgi:hypothetical protein
MRESACRKNVMTKNKRNTEKKGIKYKMIRRGIKRCKMESRRGNIMNKHRKSSYIAAIQ